MKFDKVIGLGQSCQVAHQIRANFPQQTESYILDWFGLYDRQSLMRLLKDGVHNLAQAENIEDLGFHDHKWRKTRDKKYNVSMLHAFLRKQTIEEAYPVFREKMNYLADRWENLMASRSRVLFVRLKAANDEGAFAFIDALSAAYPQLDFSLLVLNFGECPLQIQTPQFFHASIAASKVWTGHDESWKRIFEALAAAPEPVGAS